MEIPPESDRPSERYPDELLLRLVRRAVECEPLPPGMKDVAAFARRCRDAAVEPAVDRRDESFRAEIRRALGAVHRATALTDDGSYLPGNGVVIDAVCAELSWFGALGRDDRKWFYHIAGELVRELRVQLLEETATKHSDLSTRASAGQLARSLKQQERCEAQLAEIDPFLGEVQALSDRAGRTVAEVSEMLATTEPEIQKAVRTAAVQLQILKRETQ